MVAGCLGAYACVAVRARAWHAWYCGVWAVLWCVSMAGRRCHAPVHRQSEWARCCGDDAAGWRWWHQLSDGLSASYCGCCPARGITQRWLVDAIYSSSLLAALSAQVHGWTPLGIACNRGKLEVAVALIRRGAGVNLLLVCAALCAHLFHSVLFSCPLYLAA